MLFPRGLVGFRGGFSPVEAFAYRTLRRDAHHTAPFGRSDATRVSAPFGRRLVLHLIAPFGQLGARPGVSLCTLRARRDTSQVEMRPSGIKTWSLPSGPSHQRSCRSFDPQPPRRPTPAASFDAVPQRSLRNAVYNGGNFEHMYETRSACICLHLTRGADITAQPSKTWRPTHRRPGGWGTSVSEPVAYTCLALANTGKTTK